MQYQEVLFGHSVFQRAVRKCEKTKCGQLRSHSSGIYLLPAHAISMTLFTLCMCVCIMQDTFLIEHVQMRGAGPVFIFLVLPKQMRI